MSQGLLDDVQTNVTTVTLLKNSSSTATKLDTRRTVRGRDGPSGAVRINIGDVIASTLEKLNLQKAAVRDALRVLLRAKLELGSGSPSGRDMINMIRKVNQTHVPLQSLSAVLNAFSALLEKNESDNVFSVIPAEQKIACGHKVHLGKMLSQYSNEKS